MFLIKQKFRKQQMRASVSNTPSERVWIYRIIFLAIAIFLILVNLMPLQTTPQNWPWPNILLLVIFCWSLREPNFVPVPLIIAILLLQDFLLHRPPGLFSGISVIILIWIKAITARSDDKSFLAEWVRVSLAYAAISLIYHLALLLLFVNTTELRVFLIQTILNISTYPFIVLVSHYIFRVKRPYFTRSGRVI